MRKPTFSQETRDLKPDDPRYIQIKARYDAEEARQKKESAYQYQLIRRILDLSRPVKGLNVSKLHELKTDELTKIGKATKALYDILKENGLHNW